MTLSRSMLGEIKDEVVNPTWEEGQSKVKRHVVMEKLLSFLVENLEPL